MKNRLNLKLILSGFGLLTAAGLHAATLTAVPMQGGMVMPMVAYHAEHGHLHVMLDPTVPQLTPLLVSHPGDHFNSGDPWFSALDPSRGGLAFSRRYGFVMDSTTDPLPEGRSIWIRRLSASPELGIYRYANSEPKAWEPIFGTAGSAAHFRWNGMMFHPTVTAPPGTNTYRATFQVYVGDNSTGEEVAGSASDPFELNWTTIPDGRPALTIATRVLVSWPATATNYVLESTSGLPAAEWTAVGSVPSTQEGQASVLLEPGTTTRFFRLRPIQ